MSTKIQAILKQVGRGKTLSRDLDRAQAREAIELLLGGAFSPSQAGAFLQAMRIKEATLDEILGSLDALEGLRESSPYSLEPGSMVVNVAFDTPRKGGVVSILACAYLRRTSLAKPVLVWEPPSLFPTVKAVEETARILESDPWLAAGGCPLVAVHEMVPGWTNLGQLRSELGFRTILNTLEKLVTPVAGAPIVAGISHGSFFGRLAEVFAQSGARRAVVVKGHHGTCDQGFGVEATRVAVSTGVGSAEELEIPAPTQLDASLLLLSGIGRWPEQLAEPGSALREIVREQAAFLLWAATGQPMHQAREQVRTAGEPHGR